MQKNESLVQKMFRPDAHVPRISIIYTPRIFLRASVTFLYAPRIIQYSPVSFLRCPGAFLYFLWFLYISYYGVLTCSLDIHVCSYMLPRNSCVLAFYFRYLAEMFSSFLRVFRSVHRLPGSCRPLVSELGDLMVVA